MTVDDGETSAGMSMNTSATGTVSVSTDDASLFIHDRPIQEDTSLLEDNEAEVSAAVTQTMVSSNTSRKGMFRSDATS